MSWLRLTGRRPRTATGWFARLQSREVSPAERVQFRRWLEVDPKNQEDFRRREELWQCLECVTRDELLTAETRRMLSQPPRGTGPRAHLNRWSVVVAGLALASIATWWAAEFAGIRTMQTAVGEQQLIVLPDGSRVTVNTNSQLRIDYRFGRRRIKLEWGEALFDVAHDAAHPFVVRAAQTVVTALGTEFAVAKSAEGVEVSVLEGRVRAETSRSSDSALPGLVLNAGHAGRLASQDREWTRAEADSARIRAWQAKRLQFQNVTLEAVVAEFNRYSNTQLVIEDRRLATLPVSGVFRIGQTESLVRALVEVYPIRVHRESRRIILRFAASPVTPTQHLVVN